MNQRLQTCIFVIISFLLISASSGSSAAVTNPLSETSGGSVDYYPGVIVVKLKEGRTLRDIQELNTKHNVKSVKNVFMKPVDRKQKRAELEAALAKAKTGDGKIKLQKQVNALKDTIAHLEKRQQRAPKGVTAPTLENIYYLEVDPKSDIPALVSEYKLHPALEYAEPKYKAYPDVVPNDTYWGTWQPYPATGNINFLWGLEKILAPLAWDLTVGRQDVIVTNIEGIEITHEDFGFEDLNQNGRLDPGEDKNGNGILDTGNIWTNDIELNGLPGVDDDGNNYIDDFYGVYFPNWSSNYTTLIQSSAHGTHTAGTMAAVGNNNIGIAGVSWRSKIMSAGPTGVPEGIRYAADNGADVINGSWRAEGLTVKQAIEYAYAKGCVIVVSAGNFDAETTYQAPAKYEEVITVAAANYQDSKASFSSYGVKTDVTAPGVDVGSTYLSDYFGGYYRLGGTSMSSPHVAGLAALIIARNLDLNESDPAGYPLLTNEEIRQIIRNSADDVLDSRGIGENRPGFDIFSGYGRINAYHALQYTSACEANMTSPIANLSVDNYDYRQEKYYHNGFTIVSGTIDIHGVAQCRDVFSNGFRNFRVEIGLGMDPQNWTLLRQSTLPVTGVVPDNFILSGLNTETLANGAHVLRLTVTDTAGNTFEDRMKIDVARALMTNLPRQGEGNWTDNVLVFEPFTLRGYATGPGFVRYYLEAEAAANPGAWVRASQDMTTRVTNGVLFSNYDNTQLPDGISTLKLVVEDSITGRSEDKIIVENDKPQFPNKPGFPITTLATYGYSSPVTGDINNDGNKEIVIGAFYDENSDGTLYAFESNGNQLFSASLPGVLRSSPAVGNLDSDPALEIGVKTVRYDSATGSYSHNIAFYDSNGTPLSSWTTLSYPISDYSWSEQRWGESSLIFYDIDGDGIMEIIFGTSATDGGRVYCYRSNGTPCPGWENGKPTLAQVVATPVVGDLNHDGIPEIVAKDKSPKIYAWTKAGQNFWAQPLVEYGSMGSNGEPRLALADLNKDGYLEIISTTYHPSGVSIWKYDGTLLLQKTLVQSTSQLKSFSIGDIDNDGLPEIILTASDFNNPDEKLQHPIFCIRSNGDSLPGWPVYADAYLSLSSPLIADINNDGIKDILVAFLTERDKDIQAYQPDGTKLTGVNWPIRKTGTANAMMALDDLDNDGHMELIFRGANSALRVWDLPYAYRPAAVDWPMFQHDAQHTGLYSSAVPGPMISGFWPGTASVNPFVFVFGDRFVANQTSVSINGVSYPTQVVNYNLLIFTLSANVVGPIKVTTPDGDPGFSTTSFGIPLSGLMITGVWPSQTKVGQFVFVFGWGYVPNRTTVSVNGVPAPLVQAYDNGLLIFVIPQGASTGKITISTPTGGSVTSTGSLIITP